MSQLDEMKRVSPRRRLAAGEPAKPRPGYSALDFYAESKFSDPLFHDKSIPTAKVPTLERTFLPVNPIREIDAAYLARAEEPPRRLERPRKLLVILDLNGTLFYKSKYTKTGEPRPGLGLFNKFLFANFSVMVWSSAGPGKVENMVRIGFGEWAKDLSRVWSRDFFGLHEADYHRRVLTVKDLEYVWEVLRTERQQALDDGDSHVDNCVDSAAGNLVGSTGSEQGQSKGAPVPHPTLIEFDQSNTIIIDDSAHKTQLQPYNRLLVNEFTGQRDDITLIQAMAYLNEAMFYDNVSAFIRRHPFTTSRTLQTDLVRSLLDNCFKTAEHIVERQLKTKGLVKKQKKVLLKMKRLYCERGRPDDDDVEHGKKATRQPFQHPGQQSQQSEHRQSPLHPSGQKESSQQQRPRKQHHQAPTALPLQEATARIQGVQIRSSLSKRKHDSIEQNDVPDRDTATAAPTATASRGMRRRRSKRVSYDVA